MTTKTWDGGATGNWNVSGNWSPSGVPATGDDVIINTSGCDVTLDVHIGGGQTNTGLGSLTITAGTLDTNDGSNRMLTVTGDAIIDGTLTGNASAISLGSLAVGGTYSATSGTTTITSERSNGRATDIVGTYNHNGGILKIQTPADTDLRWPSSSNCNHLIIDHASCIARPTGDNKPPIAGNLLINQGKFSLLDSDGSATHQCTVTGDVIIGDGSGSANTAIFEGRDDSVTFGSLTIDSDGKYDATSGTTTLTSTSSNYSINNAGTFTHNNGTVKIDFETPNFNSNSKIKLNQMYNLEIEMNRTTDMTLLEPESGTTLTVLNNVTVKKGVLTKNSHTHTLDFKGLTVVGVGGGSLAAHIDASTSGSATSNFGALTILTDGKYTQSTTTNVSSIRNVGGTIA